MANKRDYSIGKIIFRSITAIIFIFLLLPTLIIVLSAFSPTEYATFPPQGFSLRWFTAVFTDQAWVLAIENSLKIAVVTIPIATIIGTLAAYGIYASNFHWKSGLQAFVLSPIMLPAIILGISFLYLATAFGLLGSYTIIAAGHIIVAIPYVFRSVTNVLVGLNKDIQRASMILGATPFKTFLKVVMPNIISGVFLGAVFAGITSLGEVSISLLVSSSQTVTIPVQTMNYIDQTFDPSVNAVAVIFIIIAIVLITILEKVAEKNKIDVF
ncbi:ABC transporter permease [Loigolactobacillus binensis]|uniref:ABC transporter permease n=1 Tax=Loigolactobacillus binensis TaxID=2559922 RepID=A0ABW3EE08_9LACO|nr:ABC transporter permease [Loigolactobacillus binensis]